MVFVWDEKKNHGNRRKHGLSFETAARTFEDPSVASQPPDLGVSSAVRAKLWL